MKNLRLHILFIALLPLLFLSTCDWTYLTEDYQRFSRDLQGTWISNDRSIYSGRLEIGYDRITITGYEENQTPPLGNDARRPFRGFTKGTALKGYSEEGEIFIQDGGMLQEGIPYIYWDDSPPPDYKKVKFLRFTFGDRVETLQSQ